MALSLNEIHHIQRDSGALTATINVNGYFWYISLYKRANIFRYPSYKHPANPFTCVLCETLYRPIVTLEIRVVITPMNVLYVGLFALYLAHIHTNIHTYIQTYIHKYLDLYIPAYIITYIHKYIHTYTHSCIRKICIHAYTYIQTYIHNTYAYTAIPKRIHTQVHGCMHTYIHSVRH